MFYFNIFSLYLFFLSAHPFLSFFYCSVEFFILFFFIQFLPSPPPSTFSSFPLSAPFFPSLIFPSLPPPFLSPSLCPFILLSLSLYFFFTAHISLLIFYISFSFLPLLPYLSVFRCFFFAFSFFSLVTLFRKMCAYLFYCGSLWCYCYCCHIFFLSSCTWPRHCSFNCR